MPKTPKTEDPIDLELTRAYDKLKTLAVDTQEYISLLNQVERLEKLKATKQPKRLDPNTLATIGANLTGICLILGHEHTHVITSKAMSLLSKLR